MEDTDELENSLFASLLSKPKERSRSSLIQKPPTKHKLFDIDDDDIIDLLSDGEQQTKIDKQTLYNDRSSTASNVQFGSYVPSAVDTTKGPLDFPILQKQIPTSSKAVHFKFDSTEENNDTATVETLNVSKESNDRLNVKTSSVNDHIIDKQTNENFELLKESLLIEIRQKNESISVQIQEIIKEQETKLNKLLSVLEQLNKQSEKLQKVDDSKMYSLIEKTNHLLVETMQQEFKTERETLIKENTKLLEHMTQLFNEYEMNNAEKYNNLCELFKLQQKCTSDKEQHVLHKESEKLCEILTKLEEHIYQKEKQIEQRESKLTESESELIKQQVAFNEEKLKSKNIIEEEKILLQKSKDKFMKEQHEFLKNHTQISHEEDCTAEHKDKINRELKLLKIQLENERDLFSKTLNDKARQLDEERAILKKERKRLLEVETNLNIKAIQVSETYEIAQRLYCEGEKALNKAYLLENHLEQQFHILKRQQCQLKENEKRIVMERMILVNKQRESEDHIAPPTDTPTTSQYSLQQILQKIDQDDSTLAEEKVFLQVVQTPPTLLDNIDSSN